MCRPTSAAAASTAITERAYEQNGLLVTAPPGAPPWKRAEMHSRNNARPEKPVSVAQRLVKRHGDSAASARASKLPAHKLCSAFAWQRFCVAEMPRASYYAVSGSLELP